MTKITWSLILAAVFALCLHVASAQAQYVHTCVSAASGNDANTCHCTQPCRAFQRAHDQTLSDGQITVLDPGGYGPVTITKSISIVNDDAVDGQLAPEATPPSPWRTAWPATTIPTASDGRRHFRRRGGERFLPRPDAQFQRTGDLGHAGRRRRLGGE